jgi:hypothetical protein
MIRELRGRVAKFAQSVPDGKLLILETAIGPNWTNRSAHSGHRLVTAVRFNRVEAFFFGPILVQSAGKTGSNALN